MRISDWSSDVCSSDLRADGHRGRLADPPPGPRPGRRGGGGGRGSGTAPPAGGAVGSTGKGATGSHAAALSRARASRRIHQRGAAQPPRVARLFRRPAHRDLEHHQASSSEEHTSELQSLMRISYAVFSLTKTITPNTQHLL